MALRWFLRVLVTAFFLLSTCRGSEENSQAVENETEDLVTLNPAYEAPVVDENGDDSQSDGDEGGNRHDTSVEDRKHEDARSVLDQALSKTRKARSRTMLLVKRNKLKITIALALFAFRKEIQRLLLLLFTTPNTIDPETGEVLTRTVHISATSILKIFLFISLMRRLQSGQPSSDIILLALGPQGMFVSQFLSRLFSPIHTAFVPPIEQHWTFERVNERYTRDALALKKALPLSDDTVSQRSRMTPATRMHRSKNDPANFTTSSKNDTVILLDWTGLTPTLTQMPALRDQVSFLLSQYRSESSMAKPDTPVNAPTTNGSTGAAPPVPEEAEVEIVVLLESPGGSAADYGLAAQQIVRLRDEPGVKLTVCVDKVAASGGYMIACCSSPGRLYAAPFAVVGSIGVIGTTINIHSVLQGWGVKPLVFRGGKDKAPVGLIGEVTKDGIEKVQSTIDKTHVAFKRHVVEARPVLAEQIHHIATGDIWLGHDALKVGLVDRIVSSDEYIGERLREGARVLKLVKYERPRLHFPPLSPTRPFVKSWNAVSHCLRAILIDLPSSVTKLVQLVDESLSLQNGDALATVAKSCAVARVETSANF